MSDGAWIWRHLELRGTIGGGKPDGPRKHTGTYTKPSGVPCVLREEPLPRHIVVRDGTGARLLDAETGVLGPKLTRSEALQTASELNLVNSLA